MRPPAAAPILLAGSLLLAGCPGGSKEAGPPPDPAVTAALAKRPDLARGRVWILGLDGCDPGLVRDLAAAGRLPNFSRLMKEGAFGPLRSQLPMLSPLLWTTVATGKYPTEHGVLDFMVRSRADPGAQEAVTSRHRRTESIWDVVGRHGRTVGVVGWLASHPAERVNGFAVSERTEHLAYLYNEGIAASDEGKTFPPGLLAEIAPLRRAPSAVPYAEAKPFLHVGEDLWKAACRAETFTDENRINNMRLILAGADNFRRVDLHLWREKRPALFCTYFEMLDAVSHYFMAYRDPVTWKPRSLDEVKKFFRGVEGADPVQIEAAWRRFRGEAPPGGAEKLPPEMLATIRELATGADPEKAARFRDAVDAAYEWTDRLLGEAMAACDADTTLLVVSDHGFASGPGKPPFDSSFRSRLGGANFHLPDGVFGAWGRGVRKGFEVPPVRGGKAAAGVRLIDLAPTALALLGFPKAEDMPGRVAAEIFDLDLATGAVPTYETGRPARLARERIAEDAKGASAGGGREAAEESALDDAMKSLSAVGYVGTAEEGPVRAMTHMAASYLEQGRLAEAEEAFAEALKSARGEGRLHCLVQIGNVRARREDAAGARKAFEEALAGHPKFVEALFGLARLDRTVAAWERVVDAAPENPVALFFLADALRVRFESTDGGGRADLERAVALVGRAFAPPPGAAPGDGHVTAAGHNLGGMVLLRAGDFRGAAEHFRRAASLQPDYVRPRTNLGVLHLNLANTATAAKDRSMQRAEALHWFGEALDIEPRNAKALYNRAEVHAFIEPRDPAAAERDLRAALAADPQYGKAALLLDKVTKGREPPR